MRARLSENVVAASFVLVALVTVAVLLFWKAPKTRPPHERIALIPAALTLSPLAAGTQCATHSTGCAQYLLNMMNAARRVLEYPPLRMDWSLTRAGTGCSGATLHAQDMANTGSLWHVNPDFPTESFPTDICRMAYPLGQNVGGSYGLSKQQMVLQTFMAMMSEPHSASECGTMTNHACNILSPHFGHIGIGFGQNGSFSTLVEDFTP